MGVVKPINDKQLYAIKSNCDMVFLTGNAGGGKTHVACMYYANYVSKNPKFKGIFIRKNIEKFWMAGGIGDTMKEVYPLREAKSDSQARLSQEYTIGELVRSKNMGIRFDNGASYHFHHIANENQDKIEDAFRGMQGNAYIFDEAHEYLFTTVFFLPTRLRGKGKGKKQILILQNPERECWARTFLGDRYKGIEGAGYIDEQGDVIDDMEGVVRFFYMVDGTLTNIIFGASKEEVYERAKDIIDEQIKKLDKRGKLNYTHFIKSCVFYNFSALDNDVMIQDNPDYIGNLANSVSSQTMLLANWNHSKYDEKEDVRYELGYGKIASMFQNPPNKNGKIRITVDPATTGEDNMVLMAWDGWHCFDIEVNGYVERIDLATVIRNFMNKHGVRDNSRLCIDSNIYGELVYTFNGCQTFLGTRTCSNRGQKIYHRIKDEAAHKMVDMISEGLITFAPHLADMVYKHARLSKNSTVLLQMTKEAKTFTFEEDNFGKIKLKNKSNQGYELGGKSPDLLDNCVILVGCFIYDAWRILATRDNGNNPKNTLMPNINTEKFFPGNEMIKSNHEISILDYFDNMDGYNDFFNN